MLRSRKWISRARYDSSKFFDGPAISRIAEYCTFFTSFAQTPSVLFSSPSRASFHCSGHISKISDRLRLSVALGYMVSGGLELKILLISRCPIPPLSKMRRLSMGGLVKRGRHE